MGKIILVLLVSISFVNGAIKEVKQYQSTSIESTSTGTPIISTGCTFDPCILLNKQFCLNDGKCVLNQNTCSVECTCEEGYSGEKCQNESEPGQDSNIQSPGDSKSERSDCSGEICIHGNCVPALFGTTRCECHEGWYGTSCGIAGAVVDTNILEQLSNDYPEILSGIGVLNLPKEEEIEREQTRLKNDTGDNQSGEYLFLENESIGSPLPEVNNSVIEVDDLEVNVTVNSTIVEVNGTVIGANGTVIGVDGTVIDANGTVVEALVDQRFNVCSDEAIERSEEDRVCKNADLRCAYGVCEETLTDYGSWKGYTTVCKCDPGARGTFCEHICCLDCGENGKCDIRNVTEHCNCRQQYTGPFCEIYVPNPVSIQVREDTWYLWIVGVCVGTFVVLVTLAVLGPYFMWKHRVILIMKIVHYFQPYEDSDEKEWDAFVSYKSHHVDEHFVVHVLYPKLERELGFKLCLHFRDFVPGETISNNIINAVEGSRRTIVILTPRYVESEFTRFEYQKAQTEMLKRKHRIIPIVLEDISGVTNMDKNLKGIINSVTYLEWPNSEERAKKEEKFWKRLALSLPKKKVKECENNNSVSQMESSINSKSKDISVSSEWFESSHITTDKDTKKTPAECCEENIYSEIGALDDNLGVPVKSVPKSLPFGEDVSETVKPLTEEEELELIKTGSNEDDYTDPYKQDDHYVDMEHDRYIEFSLEDNPPSASLQRKRFPTAIKLQTDGYIEVDV